MSVAWFWVGKELEQKGLRTVLQSKRFNFVSFYIKLYNLKPDVY